jgi:hypothetical protein
MERERRSNERADGAEEVEVVGDGTMREGVAVKSQRLSVVRKGYKAGRFTYCATERVLGEVSVPVSGGAVQGGVAYV